MEDGELARLAGHVGRLLGTRVESGRRVHGGWSIAVRGVFQLPAGRSVFAKMGTVPDTIAAIRQECRVRDAVAGPFAVQVLAKDAQAAVMVLKDLSRAEWPPPWNNASLKAVKGVLEELAATEGPLPLPTLTERLREWGEYGDLAWAEGTALVHCDVRSDNVCIRDGRAILVDWNHAARGNPLFDRVLWAPTVKLEGGPAPWELVPEVDPRPVAYLRGYFGEHMLWPAPEGAPEVRGFQRAQFEVVDEWLRRLGASR